MERERCAVHGLAVGEGGCVRCRHEAQRVANRRGLALLGAIAVVGAGGIVAARGALDARARAPHVVAAAAQPTATVATPTATAIPAPTPTDDPAARERRIQAAMRNVSVTLYTTQHCPWCKRTKAWLGDKGIAYTERPVDLDPSARAAQQRLANTTSVPVVDIEGRVNVGFDPSWMESTLRARAAERVAD